MISLIHALSICLATTMIALAGLAIYRSILSMKEDDQLFLDPAEWQLEQEQQAIVHRLGRLTPVVWGLAIAAVALLALIIGVWIYGNLQAFSTRTIL